MAAAPLDAERLRARLSKAGRHFNAWWEGVAYDADGAPAGPAAGLRAAPEKPVDLDIAEQIWGAGRTEPGEPSWTMRQARALGLATRAQVVLFGAGAGGPLRDLKSGARWKISGLSRSGARPRGLDLKSYDAALSRLNKGAADGGLCFFELHRDADPAGFARFAAEFLRSGAPLAFVDFASARKGARLKSCFPDDAPGAPRCAADYARLLKEAGFLVGDTLDETRSFMPMIARGWSRWRSVYESARATDEARARVEKLRFLADYAQLWAERLDALRSGQLQVVRLQARKAH